MDSSPDTVIGRHISEAPAAIEDVWPAVDENGIVTALLRMWDDADYVRLDAAGEPVDQIAHTHHIMPRRAFQASGLPADWPIVGTRLLARAGSRPLVPTPGGEVALGSRQEYQLLEKMNAGYGMIIETIDTTPPFTHIYEIDGDFYLIEMRPDPEVQVAAAVAEGAPAGADAAAAQAGSAGAAAPPAPEPAAGAPPAAPPAAPAAPAAAPPAAAPEDLAATIAAAAAAEALVAAEREAAGVVVPDVLVEASSASPPPPAKVELAGVIKSPDLDDEGSSRASLLDAVVAPEGSAALVDDQASSARSRASLSASVEESSWDDAVAPTSDAKSLLQAQATPSLKTVAVAREAAFAQATEFLSSAPEASPDPRATHQPVLKLEQVRKTGRFAWDEFMNLYLPHVGFVAARPERPGPDGKPRFRYLERPESALRPVGWHHLEGCDCEFCRPRKRG